MPPWGRCRFQKGYRVIVKGENVADPIGRFEDLQVVTARVWTQRRCGSQLTPGAAEPCGAAVDAGQHRRHAMEGADSDSDAGV